MADWKGGGGGSCLVGKVTRSETKRKMIEDLKRKRLVVVITVMVTVISVTVIRAETDS